MFRKLLAVALSVVALAPASAATYILNLNGNVSGGAAQSFTSGGFTYDVVTIALTGFTPLSLAAGDTVEALITLDGPLTAPSAGYYNAVDLALISTTGATPVDTDASGTSEFFLGGSSFLTGSSNTTSNGAVFNSFLQFPGTSFTFDTVQSNFTVNSLGGPLVDVDVAYLRTFAVNRAVAAVPEPATWALMIGGFGGIGGTMRYRRRKATVSFA